MLVCRRVLVEGLLCRLASRNSSRLQCLYCVSIKHLCAYRVCWWLPLCVMARAHQTAVVRAACAGGCFSVFLLYVLKGARARLIGSA
jgi:hypothetical protein